MLILEGLKVITLPSAGSTNSYVAAHHRELASPTWVIAERQLQGRGQGSHVWRSRPGDFSASLLYRPEQLPVAHVFLLSELVALAIANMLREWGYPAQIKWPNDILIAGRKVCGILIETGMQGAHVHQAILGIGINIVSWPQPPDDLAFPVTTLADASPSHSLPTPEQVARAIVYQWNALLEVYPSAMPIEVLAKSIEDDYLTHLWHGEGQHVFRDEHGIFTASIEGLAPHGALRLRLQNGELREYTFGTLRQLPDTLPAL